MKQMLFNNLEYPTECPPHDWVEIIDGEYKGIRCSICAKPKEEEPEKPDKKGDETQ